MVFVVASTAAAFSCADPTESVPLGDEQEDCWVYRAAPRAADDLSVGFVLDDEDQLYLDIQPDGDPERVQIDILDLETGERELFYQHAEGPVHILGAGLDQQMISTPERPDYYTVRVRRNAEWELFGFVYAPNYFQIEAGNFSGSRQGLVVGRGYTRGVLSKVSPEQTHASPLFDRVRGVTFADGYVAARHDFRWEDDLGFPERVSLVRPTTPPSRFEYDFTQALDQQIGSIEDSRPWILDETVIWRDGIHTWSFTLGDEERIPMDIDPLCEILDVKAGTLLLACRPERYNLPGKPHYSSLHWLRKGVWHGPIETSGTFSEAVLLNAERVVWRQWRDAEELWEESSDLKGEIMTADLSEAPRRQRLGGTFGFDRGYHGGLAITEPYLVAKGNSVAWNYDYSESGSYDEVAIGTATYVCGTPDPF